MNVLFWLYKSRKNKNGFSPLMMRVTMNSKRVDFAINIELSEKIWNQERQLVKGRGSLPSKYNRIIRTFKARAYQYYDETIGKNQVPSAEGARNYILKVNHSEYSLLGTFDDVIGNMRARIGNDIAASTVKKYETCKRKVEEYLRVKLKRGDLALYELSGKFIYQLEAYLKGNQGLSHNATMKNLQQFKRVIKVAVQNEWLDHDPFAGFSTAPRPTDRGFLTDVELQKLEIVSLPSKRLEKVRDLFIFSCYTGLAYADVAKLSEKHLIQGSDGNIWIDLSRTKSKSRSLIPLLPKAMKILEKYSPEREKDGLLLPVISNQNINKYLKEIAGMVDIYKRVSFHLARHTFATTVTLNKGVDIVSVSKMLGHQDLRTTQIYAKISMRKIAEDMKDLMDNQDEEGAKG